MSNQAEPSVYYVLLWFRFKSPRWKCPCCEKEWKAPLNFDLQTQHHRHCTMPEEDRTLFNMWRVYGPAHISEAAEERESLAYKNIKTSLNILFWPAKPRKKK